MPFFDRKCRLHLAVSRDEKDEWEQWATRKRLTLSEMIRQAVVEYIKQQEREAGK